MSATLIRERALSDEILVAPGVYDMMSLLLANRHGFGAHYLSGYWNAAATMGEPDLSIAGYRDFITPFARMAEKSTAPLIADADTGFGSLASLDHCVRGYQRAGIAAIQLEDQPFPKKCGHFDGVPVVPTAEMCARIKVAVEARGDGDMVVIARTDACGAEGLESAIERLNAYAEAGADWLFLEAPPTREDMAHAAQSTELPLMINAAHGGKTPILKPSEYQALGVSVVIYPAGAPLSASAAAEKFFTGLSQDDANPDGEDWFEFSEMNTLMGKDRIEKLQKRFGAPEQV